MVIESKRGISHIEFIFSLLIFLAFIGVALFFFAPRGTTNVVENTLDYTYDAVLNKGSVEIHEYGVKLDQDALSSNNVDIVSVSIDDFQGNVRVEDLNGNVLDSRREGDMVYIAHGGNDFVYLMISEEFIERSLTGSGVVSEDYYEVSSLISGKVLSVKKINDLEDSYESDYDSLKKDIRLPAIIDFGFLLDFKDFNDGDVSADREDRKEEVFSKTGRLEILKEGGDREFGTLTVRVW